MYGDKIKELRGDMTVREFAKKVGLSPSYISDLENSRDKKPSTASLEKISKACNKEMAYFFEQKTVKIDLKQYLEHASPKVRELLESDDAPSYIELVADLKEKGITPEEIKGVFSYVEKYYFKDKSE